MAADKVQYERNGRCIKHLADGGRIEQFGSNNAAKQAIRERKYPPGSVRVVEKFHEPPVPKVRHVHAREKKRMRQTKLTQAIGIGLPNVDA